MKMMRTFPLALVVGLVLSGAASQPAAVVLAASAGAPNDVEVDPIRCWWKADASAVLVGERFHVTLTCGVVETEATRTVANRDALESAALTLTPFEVVGGTKHEDVLAPPWRYFQYEYVVRLLGEEFFGQDVDLPPLDVAYNVVSKSTATEAREHRYRLPALPMRVMSVVPKKAADVRETTPESFGAIEVRRFRANGEMVVAALAAGFALLFFGLAVARTLGRFRRRQPVATRLLAPSTALAGCVRAIGQVQRDARDGWNADLVSRALAALRVAAAVVSGRAVAQEAVEAGTPPREGQVALRTGIVRRRSLLVSGAARSDGASGRWEATRAKARHPLAGVMDDAIRTFTHARYGRMGQIDGPALDATLGEADKAIRRLRLRTLLFGRAQLLQAQSRPGGAM
jgi:hypothetical protein